MVNHGVRLHRRVLLLGSSRKANTHEAVGQFGEGMKVGTLALLREGRRVTTHTRDEHWEWCRQHDPAFGERVLTINVSSRTTAVAAVAAAEGELSVPPGSHLRGAARANDDRSIEAALLVRGLGTGDTVTTITSITPEQWREFSRRFLFLHPPRESFRCELGELLLDDSLRASLYVKGIFICSLADSHVVRGPAATNADQTLDPSTLRDPPQGIPRAVRRAGGVLSGSGAGLTRVGCVGLSRAAGFGP